MRMRLVLLSILSAVLTACDDQPAPTMPTPVTPTTPGNVAPETVGVLAAQTLTTGGDPVTMDVVDAFRDPDGTTLTYSAVSSNIAVATVSLSGSMITITPVATGTAAITVTARDPGGLTAMQEFAVTVRAAPVVTKINRAPVVVTVISIQSGQVDVSYEYELTTDAYFEDPDGDDPEYTAESDDPDVADANIRWADASLDHPDLLTITGVSPGRTRVIVTATDPQGATATMRIVAIIN